MRTFLDKPSFLYRIDYVEMALYREKDINILYYLGKVYSSFTNSHQTKTQILFRIYHMVFGTTVLRLCTNPNVIILMFYYVCLLWTGSLCIKIGFTFLLIPPKDPSFSSIFTIYEGQGRNIHKGKGRYQLTFCLLYTDLLYLIVYRYMIIIYFCYFVLYPDGMLFCNTSEEKLTYLLFYSFYVSWFCSVYFA